MSVLNQTPPKPAAAIEANRTAIGLELGSSRIKAVLVDLEHDVLAEGESEWENQLVDGLWTYPMAEVWQGVQTAFAQLRQNTAERYGTALNQTGAIGVSAMMHGYLAFDCNDELLTAFRTWRNTNTGPAAAELSQAFGVNIPLRWSVAHLYQAILDGEDHISSLAFITTLAGYVHWQLTGQKVLGVGDCSGMFPVLSDPPVFDPALLSRFGQLPKVRDLPWRLERILPELMVAGQPAGHITAHGAGLLDPTGAFAPGAPTAAPEGDAGTGMVATGTVGLGSGNVSVGTSIFAMVVTEKPPAVPLPEIDMVATPDGLPVAMVHCNNGASELDANVSLFAQFARAVGTEVTSGEAFTAFLQAALDGQDDAGGYLAYNYLAGEPITDVARGWPVATRLPGGQSGLANFARAQVYGVFATLRLGLDILREQGIRPANLLAHGGLFKTPLVAQQLMAATLDLPITVGQTASNGGAWGMAVLAAYALAANQGLSLPNYLDSRVFSAGDFDTVEPIAAQVAGFNTYLERYRLGLAIERSIDQLH
ncbi:MAG: FGGY-family carbohydrate kinase [Micrococcales bacterium]|nr:FGGY-family carbohydrate kinase [Micrococcales bacterium]